MNEQTIRTAFSRNDGKVGVVGYWKVGGEMQTLGEISVYTSTKVMRFSSVTPMSREGLSGYATDEYITRHAAKFVNR